jgi:hypothetical protein
MAIDFEELGQKTIQSQYSTSPHIMGLVEEFRKQIDPNADIATFFHDYFDPRTARGKGLDIWGEIVGISRILEVDASNEYFGFTGQNMQNLDNAPYYYDNATNTYRLSDEAFRDLIFMKAYANIADETLPSIKQILNQILPNKTYVINGGAPYGYIDRLTTFGFNSDVQNFDHGSFANYQAIDGNKAYKVRIVFLTYDLPPYIFALFKQYGLLNRGSGVGWEYYIIDPAEIFGFDENSGFMNFDNGIFSPYGVVE